MTFTQTWIVVSDIHLRRDPSNDPRNPGGAIAQFIHAEVATRSAGTTLLLLGDFFELPSDWDEDPQTALEAVLAEHTDVMDALREAVVHGVGIVFVPGNHDAELALPEVWQRLLVEFDDPSCVQLKPWIYYVPGVLYAEHGHMHHDLNRMPTLLHTHVEGRPPLKPPLAQSSRSAAVRSIADSWLAERRSGSTQYREIVTHEAVRLGLEPEVLMELHRVSSFQPLQTASRIARVRLGMTGFGNQEQARERAGKISRTLCEAQVSVPAVVFGHTHRAEQTRIDGNATYLNAGTWTVDVRGEGLDAADGNQFPYVEISQVDGSVTLQQNYYQRQSVEEHDGDA